MTQQSHASIHFGTVLLEANRWAAQRTPTYRVSDWLARIAAAGFDGVELWENHARLADEHELAALRNSPLPFAVFNSYATLDEAGAEARRQAAALVRELRAPAVKFNFGNDPERLADELRNARAWAAAMPGVRLLCECHPGTAVEAPAVAAEALAGDPDIGVIVHPFIAVDLAAWFRHLGARIVHAHVQVVDAEWRRWRLRDRAALVQARLAILREAGFAGSFTIEFTAGVAVAPESREALFAAACNDLEFLQEAGFGTGIRRARPPDGSPSD